MTCSEPAAAILEASRALEIYNDTTAGPHTRAERLAFALRYHIGRVRGEAMQTWPDYWTFRLLDGVAYVLKHERPYELIVAVAEANNLFHLHEALDLLNPEEPSIDEVMLKIQAVAAREAARKKAHA